MTDIDTKLELSVNESDNLLSMSITNMNKARLTSLLRTDKTNHYHFWKSIGCYDYILDTILNGYTIPFYSTPPSVYLQSHRSAIIHSEIVTEAIHDHLKNVKINVCC